MANNKKTTHILHTEWSNGWGGQEIRILAESQAFVEKGYGVTIASDPHGQLFERATDAGINTVPISMHKGIDLRALKKLIQIIRNHNIGIVHTHSSVDARYGGLAARITGRPVVRSRHLSTLIKRSPLSWLLYMKLADRVITSAESIRQEMIHRNRMSSEKIIAIPAGIDEKKFSLDRDLPDIRSKLGFSDSDFVIGVVAVIRSWKGHKHLIDAVNLLKNRIPNIRLLIVGDGPIRTEIEQKIVQDGLGDHALLTGHQVDPAPYIKAMDVAILPSYSNEATSQSLPQAMAMKRPVISTNIGGLPEVVIHEKTGLLVPPSDTESIATAIQRLFDEPKLRTELSESGYRHVLEHFTFSHMIDKTESVYRSILKPE